MRGKANQGEAYHYRFYRANKRIHTPEPDDSAEAEQGYASSTNITPNLVRRATEKMRITLPPLDREVREASKGYYPTDPFTGGQTARLLFTVACSKFPSLNIIGINRSDYFALGDRIIRPHGSSR